VVVDDGSSDDTFERLRAEFDLVEVPRVMPAEVPYHSRVLSGARRRGPTRRP
jgi:glycosyltransferase involved in cell wall biosynthesis